MTRCGQQFLSTISVMVRALTFDQGWTCHESTNCPGCLSRGLRPSASRGAVGDLSGTPRQALNSGGS
eukprot:8337828-Pyramimonas_sp.AAC.1